MDFDYESFYERLQTEVRVSSDFAHSVAALMDWGAHQISHADWSRLAVFDAAAEISSARRWLPRVLTRAPCPFPIRGAFIGLGEFQDRNGVEYADLYCGLMSTYDSTDAESKWLYSNPRHYPQNAYLKSKALKQGGLLCNREATPPRLGTPGSLVVSVSVARLLIRHVLHKEVFRFLAGTAPIGIVTGFDSGDLFRLGEITPNGFVPNENAMV